MEQPRSQKKIFMLRQAQHDEEVTLSPQASGSKGQDGIKFIAFTIFFLIRGPSYPKGSLQKKSNLVEIHLGRDICNKLKHYLLLSNASTKESGSNSIRSSIFSPTPR